MDWLLSLSLDSHLSGDALNMAHETRDKQKTVWNLKLWLKILDHYKADL